MTSYEKSQTKRFSFFTVPEVCYVRRKSYSEVDYCSLIQKPCKETQMKMYKITKTGASSISTPANMLKSWRHRGERFSNVYIIKNCLHAWECNHLFTPITLNVQMSWIEHFRGLNVLSRTISNIICDQNRVGRVWKLSYNIAYIWCCTKPNIQICLQRWNSPGYLTVY